MSLHLILGPMFASKSTELITHLQRLSCVGQQVLAINHSWDQQRHLKNEEKTDTKNQEKIQSHHGFEFPAVFCQDLISIMNMDLYQKASVVAIDEGQFFPDLFEQVLKMVEQDHKHVYVAGLNGTAERTNMGQIHLLIPLADDIQFQTAFCALCQDGMTKGIFSLCKASKETQVQIGADDLYMAVCRKHYLNHHLTKEQDLDIQEDVMT